MNWTKELDAVISVCDAKGIIIDMNDKAIEHFAGFGGKDLLGNPLVDCHPEPSKTMLKQMLTNHSPNTYITEKNGVRKLVAQLPWWEENQFQGFVEIQIEIQDQ